MNILVFEDAQVPKLYPITIGRPAYAITCGSYRLVDWLSEFTGSLVSVVRPHLREIQRSDFPCFKNRLDERNPWTVVVNARMVPSHSNYHRLQEMAGHLTSAVEGRYAARVSLDGWSVAAGIVPTEIFEELEIDDWVTAIEQFSIRDDEALSPEARQSIEYVELGFELATYPHEVIRANARCFLENLDFRIHQGLANQRYQELASGVFVGPEVVLDQYVVSDTTRGPIVIDEGAKVGPFSVIHGPVYVGPNSRINEHAAVKDFVSLGHTTKIGGEVEACVIEPYTNKQHHGFLGHSYLGSWINLGAGTCNSDLKNTYGQINMQYGDERVATDMQFIGCTMGDYSKTAINTSIFTGKTVGACSMLYGFVTTNVPSYVNYARTFQQMTELPPAVMISTQNRMFQRRGVEQRPCDIQLLNDMFDLTRRQRQISEEPLSF